MIETREVVLNDVMKRPLFQRKTASFIHQRAAHDMKIDLLDDSYSRASLPQLVEAKSELVVLEKLSVRQFKATSELATPLTRILEMTSLEASHRGTECSK